MNATRGESEAIKELFTAGEELPRRHILEAALHRTAVLPQGQPTSDNFTFGLVGLLAAVTALAVVASTVIGLEGTRLVDRLTASGSPRSVMSESEGFELVLTVPHGRYRPHELIEPVATLTYKGPDDSIVVWGSGSGLVGFGVAAERGPRIGIDPGARLDCEPYELQRETPIEVPFFKSGGFDNSSPQADFLRSYFSQPELILPSGPWEVVALAAFAAECGGNRIELRTTVNVVVDDE